MAILALGLRIGEDLDGRPRQSGIFLIASGGLIAHKILIRPPQESHLKKGRDAPQERPNGSPANPEADRRPNEGCRCFQDVRLPSKRHAKDELTAERRPGRLPVSNANPRFLIRQPHNLNSALLPHSAIRT